MDSALQSSHHTHHGNIVLQWHHAHPLPVNQVCKLQQEKYANVPVCSAATTLTVRLLLGPHLVAALLLPLPWVLGQPRFVLQHPAEAQHRPC